MTSTPEEPAHDVLAAEEFGVPAPDPSLRDEPPHDVLAAEEFGVPAPDPALHHGPVRLPADPTGIEEPHDVLAAEEWPLPAPTARAGSGRRSRAAARLGLAALLVAGVALARRGGRKTARSGL